MAARYWRICSLRPWGDGDLALTELRFFEAGLPVDGSATISSTIAPVSGATSALADGDATVPVVWSHAAWRAARFAIIWDFGSGSGPANPTLQAGADVSQATFLRDLLLQYSADAVTWSTYAALVDVLFPGAHALTSTSTGNTYVDQVLLDTPDYFFRLNDASGVVVHDLYGRALGAYSGGVTLGGAAFVPGAGAGSVTFSGVGDGRANLGVATMPAAFSLEFIVSPAASGHRDLPHVITRNGYYAVTTADFPFRIRWDAVNAKLWMGLSSGNDFTIDAELESAPLTVNQPHHVVANVRNSGLCELFVDGALHDDTTITFALSNNERAWQVGGAYDYAGGMGNSGFAGRVGEVALYSRDLLSAERVSAHHAAMAAFTSLPTMLPRHLRPRAIDLVTLAQAPVTTPVAGRALPRSLARDMEFAGRHAVVGTVKIKGTPNMPARRKVRLLRDIDGLKVRETWSDKVTGAFAFTGLTDAYTYTAQALDHTGIYRTVASDRIVAEVPA